MRYSPKKTENEIKYNKIECIMTKCSKRDSANFTLSKSQEVTHRFVHIFLNLEKKWFAFIFY